MGRLRLIFLLICITVIVQALSFNLNYRYRQADNGIVNCIEMNPWRNKYVSKKLFYSGSINIIEKYFTIYLILYILRYYVRSYHIRR